MMRDLLMPKLGLTMTEGLISEWIVSPGQTFSKGDILFVVETEKTNIEVVAEDAGVIVEVLVPQGDIVPVGTVIARWRRTADSGAAPTVLRPGQDATPVTENASGHLESRAVATPLARRLAKSHGVDLRLIRGSGPSGRIEAADVEAAASMPSGRTSPSGEPPAVARFASVDQGTRVAPGPVHAAMARRLAAVKQSVPHFYLSSEAEVSALLTLRESLNADPGSRRITINHVALAAVGRALLDLPWANRVWDNGDLINFSSTDVGIAVHTTRGLFAPILRDAGRLGLADVATETSRLVDKAREGRMDPNDMVGGAITVSNAGMFNVTYLTPIINPGHSAILGVGSVRRVIRPDEGGQPVLRREIGLVLACDHRVFDGVAGLEVLNRIITYIENPQRLLGNPGVAR